MYCAIDDASNNSLKNKLEQYDNINKFDFDNYGDVSVNNNIQTNARYPSFFNAQGDYEKNNNGTTINQLQSNTNQSLIDSLSFDDVSSELNVSSIHNNKALDHDYCINVITKELLNNGNESLMSSHDGRVYKHVKGCKICKNKIKSIMKERYCDNNNNNSGATDSDNKLVETNKIIGANIMGYEIKELVLIILGGIMLIFIFDLLVRMGSKLR